MDDPSDQKLDAAIAGNNAPDVVEMGNTETTKYMAAGAFAPVQAKSFPNSKTWLSGLKDSCTYGGKLLCVPYYTGARAVIYRKDYYSAAGLKGTPKTLDQFVADGKKLMKKYGSDRNFSAFYFPGKNWYASMGFVYDYGGQIAVRKGGKWKGTLNSPQAIRALTKLKSVVRALSRAPSHRGRSSSVSQHSLRKGKRGFVRRERVGMAVHARPEGRKSGPRTSNGRVSDAEPHQGSVHADFPGRL